MIKLPLTTRRLFGLGCPGKDDDIVEIFAELGSKGKDVLIIEIHDEAEAEKVENIINTAMRMERRYGQAH